MTRTLRHLLMPTSIGLAMVALQVPGTAGVQAYDSTTCMQDVQALRDQPSLGKGSDTTIDAAVNAAEQACIGGDYGQASAYIADARRRVNLREAQRDDFGAHADDTQEAGGTATSAVGRAPSADDDDDSIAEDVADKITDVADDVGDEITDVADDVDDELEDIGDDIEDTFDDLFGEDENVPNTPATRAATRALLGRESAEGEPTARVSTSLRGDTAAGTGRAVSFP